MITPDDIRRLQRFQALSPRFVRVDLTALTGSALELAARAILADAARADRATMNSFELAPGELREEIQTDQSGRRISRFRGDPEACWGPFKQRERVARFQRQPRW